MHDHMASYTCKTGGYFTPTSHYFSKFCMTILSYMSNKFMPQSSNDSNIIRSERCKCLVRV